MEGKNTEDRTQQVSAKEGTLQKRILYYYDKKDSDKIKHHRSLTAMLGQCIALLKHETEQIAKEQLCEAIKDFTNVYITVQRESWEDKLLERISALGTDEIKDIHGLLWSLSKTTLSEDVRMKCLDEFYNNPIFQDLPYNKAWYPELKYNANNNGEDPAAQQGGEQDL